MKSKLIIPLVILFVLILGVSSITIIAFYTRDNNANERNNSNIINTDSENESSKDETPSINGETKIPTETDTKIEESEIEVQEQTKVEDKTDNNLKYSSSNNSSSTKANTSSSNNSSSNNTLNENKNPSTTTSEDPKPVEKGICTTSDSEYNIWLSNF